jgi:hypothetical protein
LSFGLSIEALRSVRIVNDEQIRFVELARDLAQSSIALLGLRVPDDKAARSALDAWFSGPRPRQRDDGGGLQIPSLFAWRSGAREEFELKDGPEGRRRRRCASRILEFEFLSRRIASKQSMKGWRWGSTGR